MSEDNDPQKEEKVEDTADLIQDEVLEVKEQDNESDPKKNTTKVLSFESGWIERSLCSVYRFSVSQHFILDGRGR